MPRKTDTKAVKVADRLVASMRPRPDAAENLRMSTGTLRLFNGFNEAAARCRGKPAVPMRGSRTV